MIKRSARPPDGNDKDLPVPKPHEIESWRSGRRDRFDNFRKAWVGRQRLARIPTTVWEFRTWDRLSLVTDVTAALARMVDFVCAVTGVNRLMTPPGRGPGRPLVELIPEGLGPHERVVFEASAYFASPHVYPGAEVDYPEVVIRVVAEKLHGELTLLFGHPPLYEEPLDELVDDDEAEFSPPPRLALTFHKLSELERRVAEAERLECQLPYLAYCRPTYETAGGLVGRAEKRCLVKAITALDGVTPGTDDWWSLSNRGPRVYYKHASAFRFALFEALLWWDERGTSPPRVTASQAAHYLKLFEQMVGDEHTIYHKLKELGLPPWRELKAALTELIDCSRSSDLGKPNSTQT